MKIALAQLNYHIGNFEANTQKILKAIEEAKQQHADLIVFAELAIGGYPSKDLFRNHVFLENIEKSIQTIANASTDIKIIIGAPIKNTDPEGKPLYNAALLMENGAVSAICKKGLLPDYDVFDEYRYFEPNKHFKCIAVDDQKIALTICEDLWDDDENGNSYVGDPMEVLAQENPDLLINIAASPFSYIHFEERLHVLEKHAKRNGKPVIYVNQVGGHTDILFDGRSVVLDQNGTLVCELKRFEEDLQYVTFENNQITSVSGPAQPPVSQITLIHEALVMGLRDYFQKSGFKKAVLGLSGGLDSAVVAALAVEALGAENVMTILMPSVYSSDHSIKDAMDLVHNTGCKHLVIPIKDIDSAFDQTLAPAFDGFPADLTEENIQARARAIILMAVSNKMGYILLNTSNKSEAAVGYGTLYGDMAGALSVIGDVYKSKAYDLAREINKNGVIIPVNTIEKAPSAELRPDQKDSDSLPEYHVLDPILYELIENEKAGSELVATGYDESLVQRISKLLFNAEFKRYQTAPTLRVSPKSFGPGRVIPLVAKYPF